MQKFLTAFALLAVTTSAFAAEDALLRCRQNTVAALRLACYDAIDVAAMPVVAKPVAARPAAEFGLPPAPAARKAQEEAIDTMVTAEFEGWSPNDIIQLANGQKWRVTDTSNVYVGPGARKVRVRRGPLGGFYMDFEGISQSPRVKRIQ